MHFLQRYGSLIAIIILLIGLSILAIVWNGEEFKSFVFRWDGLSLRKRQDSTINFLLPWKSTVDASLPHIESNAVSPLIGGLLGDIDGVASALVNEGSKIAGNVVTQAAGVESAVAAAATVLDPGVASLLSNVNNAVNEATSVIGQVLAAATAVVGSMIAEATGNVSNIGVLPSSALSSLTQTALPLASTPASTTDPQEFLPQTGFSNRTRPNSSPPFTITSSSMATSSVNSVASPMASSCSATFMPSCPPPITSTCTVTESWHSTHYEATATLFSFIAAYTVTCTETVSVCPQSMSYAFDPGSSSHYVYPTTSSTSNTSHPCPNVGFSCSECPGGWFCPPAQTPAQSAPCGFGWACGACSGGWYCVAGPTSPIVNGTPSSFAGAFTSLLNSASTMTGFTANISALTGPANGVSSILASITPSIPAFGQATISPDVTSLPENVISDVKSALSNVSGLTGGLLCTILANVNSAISAANSALGNVPVTNGVVSSALSNINDLPSSLLSTISGDVNSALRAANSVLGNVPVASVIINSALSNIGLPGNLLTSVAADINSALAAANTALGNVPTLVTSEPLSTTTSKVNAAGGIIATVVSDVNSVVGVAVPAVTSLVGNVPVVGSAVNSVLTQVPAVVSQPLAAVQSLAAGLPILSGGRGNLLGGLKQRRRSKRGDDIWEEDDYCGDRTGDDECGLGGDEFLFS